MRIQKSFFLLFLVLVGFMNLKAQDKDSTNFSIYYDSQKKLEIAEIKITGIRYLDKEVLIQLSGLKVGDEIDVPGDGVTSAIRKLWNQGLFSDVKIEATKIINGKVWIEIFLQERPKLGGVNFIGVSKSEKDDITSKVLLLVGSQVTDNQVNNAERIIKDIFLEKGFLNTDVNIIQKDDTTKK